MRTQHEEQILIAQRQKWLARNNANLCSFKEFFGGEIDCIEARQDPPLDLHQIPVPEAIKGQFVSGFE